MLGLNQRYPGMHAASRALKSELKVGPDWLFLRACEEESALDLSPSFCWFSGDLLHSLIYKGLHIHATLCVSLSYLIISVMPLPTNKLSV